MNDKLLETRKLLPLVFTPSTPVQDERVFAGRIEQLKFLLEIPGEPGVHGVLYGKRGVGKTSLANIVSKLLQCSDGDIITCKVGCDTGDSYVSVWGKVLSQLTVPFYTAERVIGFKVESAQLYQDVPATMFLKQNGVLTPDMLAKILDLTASGGDKRLVVVLDEFDRVGPTFDSQRFSDTIKGFSDNHSFIHVILVGVAKDVTGLIGEHESIERNIKQIHLPTMSYEELREIIVKGLNGLEMEMDEVVINKIISFSSGYPHYTHLLALNCCKLALERECAHVNESDLNRAIKVAVRTTHESLRSAYQTATLATKSNIFKEVLWACANAPTDEHGTFQAADLELPLGQILGKRVTVNHFVYHLGKFTSEDRGSILETITVGNRKRYKFRNPLMKPFVKLNMEIQPDMTG